MDDILTNCDGRLLWRCLDGKPVKRTGAFPFLCPKCGASFHIKDRQPRVKGICDQCGTELIQRDDDRPEAIRVRLETYDRKTAPLIEYYQKKGLLIRVECGETPQETFARTLQALKLA